MTDVKQVKVDNWGIYFLQRLKHFFNRTDFCDLTLQFQDNAQLKVHRLVLSACTEYFELLERTCEMYEDCLVMPDDLQADVVVPIVNFMYTGQLEFKLDLLERLYQTSLVMNMPVLSKLLLAHRQQHHGRPAPVHSYSKNIRTDLAKTSKTPIASSSSATNKRSYNKAFDVNDGKGSKKVQHYSSYTSKSDNQSKNGMQSFERFPITASTVSEKKKRSTEPRPTRYELPEELDEDNIFDNSFTSVSYTSKPLMIHPETVKQYGSKAGVLFEDASSSKRFFNTSSAADIVECKKISTNSNIFEDEGSESVMDGNEVFSQSALNKEDTRDASQLFDQILDDDQPKMTIEAKDGKPANNIDHAKIISEVLKKYPHLVKSNKNIKLKILNTSKAKKKVSNNFTNEEKEVKAKNDIPDFTYETDVMDSKEAARLIAMGAENIKGPWICLICGTPGRALHFTSYYKFRRHLVEVHNEKPVANICEYCGLKSVKRNSLLYHQYTKHGVQPPPLYHFPKCNLCNYVALTEAFLVKHKMSHAENRLFRCNVCAAPFATSNMLLSHIQKTGHKYSADRKPNLQCIYCLKVFLREANLYAHLKTTHKLSAKSDGIIDDSDEEKQNEGQHIRSKAEESKHSMNVIKVELPMSFEPTYEDCNIQYQIEQKTDGNLQVIPKKPRMTVPSNKHKILNSGLNTSTTNTSLKSNKPAEKKKIYQETSSDLNEYIQEIDTNTSIVTNDNEIVVIDNHEYIVQNYQLIPKKERSTEEFVIHNAMTTDVGETLPTLTQSSTMEYHTLNNAQPETSKMVVKNTTNINQPIQIVVSNEEEYKALMSSNHSIIFDDTDSNKTLAVLTAPGGTQLHPNAIDLHNAQPNDMMIIPENYPISVSETVSADNSNIVVVYSHPVDDHNKQYQLITSQGLEAQFVQSSNMITQNFETVTTCSPVMSAHVLNAPVQSWHNNIPGNISKLPTSCTSEIQTMADTAPIEVATITSAKVSNSLEELPEVQVSGIDQIPININQVVRSEGDMSINIYNQSDIIQHSVNEHSETSTMCEIIPSNNMMEQQPIANPVNIIEETVTITPVIDTATNSFVDDSATLNPIDQPNSMDKLDDATGSPLHNIGNTNEVRLNNIILVKSDTGPIVVDPEPVPTVDFSVQSNQEINNLPENNINLGEGTHRDNCSELISNQNHVVEHEFENPSNQLVIVTQTTEGEKEDLSNAEQETEIPQTLENIAKDNNPEANSLYDNTQSVHISTCDENVSSQENDPTVQSEAIETVQSDVIEPVSENDATISNENVQPATTETVQSEISKNIQTEVNEDIQFDVSEIDQSETNIDKEDILKVPSKNDLKEHVVKLASEWSDDENETQSESNIEGIEEMEESIENIQQEMEKQVAAEGCPIENDKDSEEKISEQNLVSGSQPANKDKIASHEKISSLLNDWDDNDSQEDIENEDISNNLIKEEQTEEVFVSADDNPNSDNVSVLVEKDDKIKSLVSDWDEEEEENKD